MRLSVLDFLLKHKMVGDPSKREKIKAEDVDFWCVIQVTALSRGVALWKVWVNPYFYTKTNCTH
jgi:hypothetical protein